MNEQSLIVYLDASHAPVSVADLMKMPPAIYIGQTSEKRRTVIKVSKREPIVNMQIVLDDYRISVTEYYSDGRVITYEKQMNF